MVLALAKSLSHEARQRDVNTIVCELLRIHLRNTVLTACPVLSNASEVANGAYRGNALKVATLVKKVVR
jgi:hypothetical protein